MILLPMVEINNGRTALTVSSLQESCGNGLKILRSHIGQTKPCFIYRFVTKGTIEEDLLRLHHRELVPDELKSGDAGR